jgi:KTSC domain
MGSMVTVFDPQGHEGEIPQDNLASFVKAGGKPSVTIQAPDGTRGYVPADRTQDAIKAGGKLIPIEEQPAKGFWSEAGSALWDDLKGMAAGSAKLSPKIMQVVSGADPHALDETISNQASTMHHNWKTRTEAGEGLPYKLGAAANETLGVNVTGEEQAAKEGNPGAVVGHAAAVPVASAMTAGLAKGAEVGVPKALAAASEAIAPSKPFNAGAPFPATPDPALLKSQPLATGATSAVDPAKGLGEIPPQIPGVNVRPSLERIPPEPSQIPGVNVRPNIERIKSLMDLPIPAVNQAIKELGPSAPIVTLTERANKIAALAEQGMGGKGLEPNVPLKNQSSVMTPKATSTPAIPEGHTAVESSALSSYKYDPSAQEFHAKYNGSDNTVHVFGDVSPEEAQEFEAAKSKGKAMAKIKADHSPAVAKIINGQRIAVKPVVSDEDLIPNDEWQAAHELDTHVEGTPRR